MNDFPPFFDIDVAEYGEGPFTWDQRFRVTMAIDFVRPNSARKRCAARLRAISVQQTTTTANKFDGLLSRVCESELGYLSSFLANLNQLTHLTQSTQLTQLIQLTQLTN